jgi:ABC-type nitrate/sulfonate/bicarbonate transport system substrate-binding protein
MFEKMSLSKRDMRRKLEIPNGQLLCLLLLTLITTSCSKQNLIPMQVELSRSVSKLPFVIALDQGLYKKHGLDVEVRLKPSEFDGGIEIPSKSKISLVWRGIRQVTSSQRLWRPRISVNGAIGRIFETATAADSRRTVFIAATDCTVRTRIVAKHGIDRLDDLKGKRLGISWIGSNSGFAGLLLADRMGWDPVQDISLMSNGNSLKALRDDRVDAFVASERDFAGAQRAGFPILVDMAAWNEPMAGNSIRVNPIWLEDPQNREAARRFLMATIEGIALFHQNRELALDVMARWHGITDPAISHTVYEAGRSIPRKPFPCYEGIRKAMERYDSNQMRKYSPEYFYDDSLIRELDETGFIDRLYADAQN